MHLVLPSNACVAIYPKNNSAHFKINLPETLHFPNHEIGLQRIYYCKEFATLARTPVHVNVAMSEYDNRIAFHMPESIDRPEQFAHRFVANAICQKDWLEVFVVNEKQIRIENKTENDLTLKIPTDFTNRFGLFDASTKNPIQPEVPIKKMSNLLIEATKGQVASSPTTGHISACPTAGTFRESVSLPAGYFQTGREVVNELDKTLCKVLEKRLPKFPITGLFSFNEATNRCCYSRQANQILSVDLKSAAQVFGFALPVLTQDQEAELPIEFTQGIQTMYIYSNLVESVIVGDVKVPLLGAIPFNRKLQGEREYYEFVNPSYLPMVRHPIDTIEMQLCDDMGVSLESVLRGKTVLSVHIRERYR